MTRLSSLRALAFALALIAIIFAYFDEHPVCAQNSVQISIYPNFQDAHPGEHAYFWLDLGQNFEGEVNLSIEGLPAGWEYEFNLSSDAVRTKVMVRISPPANAMTFGIVNMLVGVDLGLGGVHSFPIAVALCISNIILDVPSVIECSPEMSVEVPMHATNRIAKHVNYTFLCEGSRLGTVILGPYEYKDISLNLTSPSLLGISCVNLTVVDDAGGNVTSMRMIAFDIRHVQPTFQMYNEGYDYIGMDSLVVSMRITNLAKNALNLSFSVDMPANMAADYNKVVSLSMGANISEAITFTFDNCSPGKYTIFINVSDGRTYSLSYQFTNVTVSSEMPFSISTIDDFDVLGGEIVNKVFRITSSSTRSRTIVLSCSYPSGWKCSFDIVNITMQPLASANVTLTIVVPNDEYRVYALRIYANSNKFNVSSGFNVSLHAPRLVIQSLVVDSFPGNVLPVRFEVRNNWDREIVVDLSGNSYFAFSFAAGSGRINVPAGGTKMCAIVVNVPSDYADAKQLPGLEYVNIAGRNATFGIRANATIEVRVHDYDIDVTTAMENNETSIVVNVIAKNAELVRAALYMQGHQSCSSEGVRGLGDNWTARIVANRSSPYILEVEVNTPSGVFKCAQEISVQYHPGANATLNGTEEFSFPMGGGSAILAVRNTGNMPVALSIHIEYLDNSRSWLGFSGSATPGQFRLNYTSVENFEVIAKPVNEKSRARIEVRMLDDGEYEVMDTVLVKIEPKPKTVPTRSLAAVIAAIAAISVASYCSMTESGRFGFIKWLAPIFLYSRLDKQRVLDNDVRRQICKYIEANPGDHYSSIKAKLKLKNGVLAHHLRKLEEQEMVRSCSDGIYKRFYPYKMRIPTKDIDSLTWFQMGIYNTIKERPGISQAQIAKELGESKQVVHYHVRLMEDAGVIKVEKVGISTKCYILNGESHTDAEALG